MAHKDVQRRTWDKREYEEKAKKREETERKGKRMREEKDEKDEKEKITTVQERSDINAYNVKEMVGTRKVVAAENALSEQGGFYCEACDYLLKDHKSYLEHCNKPKHLQKVGLPMEVKKSSVEDVKKKLEMLKKKR